MSSFVATLIAATAFFFFLGTIVRKRAPRLAAMSLGLALLFAMFAGTEMVMKVAGIGRPAIDIAYPDHYYFTDTDGLQKPAPGANHLVATYIKSGKIHYDVVYTVDEHNRRVVPCGPGPFSRYAIFIGGSYTYGDGVQDAETLPAAYARTHPDVHAYDYGFHGAGPYDVLARLEATDLRGEIPESTGVVIYTMIDEHVLRTRDFLQGALYRSKKAAYKPGPEGIPVRCGTWATCHPWRHRILRVLARSRVLAMLHVEFPPVLTGRDFDRTARAICRMHDVVAEKCPGADFIVVFYPASHIGEKLIPLVEPCDVRCLDLAGAFPGLSDPYVLSPEDLHPTPDAYTRVAALISQAVDE